MIRVSFFDYIFVLRPMLFFPGWSTMLAGYMIGQKQTILSSRDALQALDLQRIGLLMTAFALAMGASFLLNQLRDIEGDRRNNKLFLISHGYLSYRSAIIEVVILILLSLIFSFMISPAVLVITVLFMFITGYLYNFPPLALKDHPWGSLLANTLMGALAFALGWLAVFGLSWRLLADILPYLFLNTALYLYTTLPDMEGDRQSAKQTLAVRYGTRKLIGFAFILYIASLIAALCRYDYQALFVIVGSSPFFIRTVRDFQVESTILTTKFTILIFAVMICLKIPYYFLIMLAGYYSTKWYFRRRFNFEYPNFKGM